MACGIIDCETTSKLNNEPQRNTFQRFISYGLLGLSVGYSMVEFWISSFKSRRNRKSRLIRVGLFDVEDMF